MSSLFRELRLAFRSLLRDKGFSATTVVTLAIGIAASAAMFAIVNGILLRPLPFPDSDSIVLMGNAYPKAGVGVTNYSAAGDYYDRLAGVSALSDQAMYTTANATIEINGTPEQLRGMSVTPSLFGVLKVNPALGRPFSKEEGEIGNERKVILTNGLWQQLFGGAANVIGRELRIGGRPYEIVGVLPRGFEFINPDVRYWIPLAFTAELVPAFVSALTSTLDELPG